ncbi:MAG: FliI/YscN family ATPase [Candidatus Eisenbacteria bacterium]|uniref:FliI/YscN family ATPase n=1 Tax=Eiseniibacteriota bacterium TaxID=2212470 RepID=A0A948W4G3_UNCEI|nr:FliI/YscN family ATPase [Candidatus Eisenbacteria bacterium]MBU1950945.1 FliI/YscN family ATPase [Candidatus Eisenbacteria bacterium]MBU2692182.1 FliI/YscN family ATPase [Candidatus Eisenbacteria bacterium]
MGIKRLKKIAGKLDALNPILEMGRVSQTLGILVEASGPKVSVGDMCKIQSNGDWIPAQVVGFRDDRILLMSLNNTRGLRSAASVVSAGGPLLAPVGQGLLGRVISGLGEPLDKKGPLHDVSLRPLEAAAPDPLERRRIRAPLSTGIRSIDAFLTLGQGQRTGILAGTGVGKSVLLGSIARHTQAQVSVIALVGERGREVREFIERDLGAGLERSVVIAATSDQPPLVRIKAALLAVTVAEYFRDQGMNVLLMMDSLTRVATAQREIGLAAGEPPTTRGYPPSAFTLLPQLLERCGNNKNGSITGLFAVLVESDDLAEPVADAARAVLDGHIVLSRRLAVSNHYPAVDVLESISRVMDDIVDPEHQASAGRLRHLIAAYREAEDAIQLGAYVKGSQPLVDRALRQWDQITGFLRQGRNEGCDFATTIAGLKELAQVGDTVAEGEKAEKQGATS